MKRLLSTLIILPILTGCISPGTKSVSIDKITNEKTTAVALGSLKVLNKIGMIHSVNSQFEIISNGTTQNKYISLFSYAESDDGRCCPNVTKGSKVIIIADDNKYESIVEVNSKVNERHPGAIFSGCLETGIKLGPLDTKTIQSITTSKNVKIRVYGERHNLDVAIPQSVLNTLKNALNE